MNREELRIVLDKHKKWLLDEEGGERANLRETNLHLKYDKYSIENNQTLSL